MTEGGGVPNLRRLRLAAGISQEKLAAAAGISRIAYQKIENGEADPKASTLQNIAAALGVKTRDLLVPVEIPSAIRFRAAKRLNSRDAIIFDVAKWLREFCDLEQCLGQKIDYPLRALSNRLRKLEPGAKRAAIAAKQAREELDLGPDEPIRDICGLLEAAGIKLYPKAIANDAFFGLAVGPDECGPAVAINVWERISVERWIFTAVHELGHLLLHLDSFDVERTEEEKAQEEEANIFASHFLMPEAVFEREWEKTGGLQFIQRVMKVKRIFRVSYKTVLHRLQAITGLGTEVWPRFQAEYKRLSGKALSWKEEPNPLEAGSAWTAYPEAHRAHEPDNLDSPRDFVPDRLAGLVRKAVENGKISLGRGAEILGIDLLEMRARAASWVGV